MGRTTPWSLRALAVAATACGLLLASAMYVDAFFLGTGFCATPAMQLAERGLAGFVETALWSAATGAVLMGVALSVSRLFRWSGWAFVLATAFVTLVALIGMVLVFTLLDEWSRAELSLADLFGLRDIVLWVASAAFLALSAVIYVWLASVLMRHG